MAEIHKRAAEDVVEYSLFPVIPDDKNNVEQKKVLEEYVRSYLTFLSPQLIDVIWQNEGFNLHHVEEQGSCPAHVHGSTDYGDNIEDEWFIVYLLFQLTKHYPGLVAKVWDSDEEFLLIEAADVLPKWVKPEAMENRVYIYNGHLHTIPVPQTPAEIASFPVTFNSVGDAVECICTYPEQTRASAKVQTAIQNRLKSFPDLMQESIHYAHCYIPASMAAILDEKPQLIASAVKAFYYRDPIDLQACRTFTYFRPGTRIMHRTKLTRCLYAQLLHQRFQPDKRSGWILPATANPKYKSHDLGMKLAHGFEILCSKSSDGGTQDTKGHTIPTNDARWQKYVKSLKDRNYFRGELEGSILYQELLDSAWKFYNENLIKKQSGPKDAGEEVLNLLKIVKYDVEEMRLLEPTLLPPDDDSWLTLTPESLDQILKSKGGNSKTDDSVDASFDLSKIADSMKNFVGNVSGIEGAEFPNEDEEEADIQFESSGFISAMQEMFEFDEESDTDSSSDMSEYGWENDSGSETKPKPQKQRKTKRPPSLDQYMDVMDKELAKTDVGKSFEKQAKPKAKETAKVTSKKSPKSPSTCDINDEDDDFQPVDIDFNTVKNLLQSYGAQEGLAGPASNILSSMGVVIPADQDMFDGVSDPYHDATNKTESDRKPKTPVSMIADKNGEVPGARTERSEIPSKNDASTRTNNVRFQDSPVADQPVKKQPPPRPPRISSNKKPESSAGTSTGRKPDTPPRRPDVPPKRESGKTSSAPRTLTSDQFPDTPGKVESGRSPVTTDRSQATPVSAARTPVTPTSNNPSTVQARRNSGPKKARKPSESSKETEV